MKLLENSSYGYHIMHWSRHTVTNYLSEEETHGAIIKKIFQNLGYINDHPFEAGLVESKIEHKEPIFVGFFSSINCKIENAKAVL